MTAEPINRVADPSPSLYRMLYRSRPTEAVATHIDAEFAQIIETSVAKNYASGLTGLLLVSKGYFIQALEGDVNEVRSTFSRISLDRRHKDLRIISQGSVERRLFAEWAMCAGNLTATDRMIAGSLANRTDFNPESLTATSAERLLVTVADIQRRAASDVLL